METNFLIGKSDLNQFRNTVFNVLDEIIPNPKENDETHKFLSNLMENLINTLLKEELFEKFKNAKQKYYDAIDKLSEIDPIQAYYLHGNTNAIEILEKLEPIIMGFNDNSNDFDRFEAFK